VSPLLIYFVLVLYRMLLTFEASGGGRSLGAMTVLAINSMGLPLLARNGAGC
jgi:hypothetical protein